MLVLVFLTLDGHGTHTHTAMKSVAQPMWPDTTIPSVSPVNHVGRGGLGSNASHCRFGGPGFETTYCRFET